MSTATLRIHDIFLFGDGRTVITGELDQPLGIIGRTNATVLLDGKSVGTIQLCSERMPGPHTRSTLRSYETYDAFPWDQRMIESKKYEIKITYSSSGVVRRP